MKFLVKIALATSLFFPILYAESMGDLSKELANPLAQIWNLSFVYNHTVVKSDVVSGSESIDSTLFQPILPTKLDNGMTFFVRPVFTFIDAPTDGYIDNSNPSNPVAIGTKRESKIGDTIIAVGAGSSSQSGWSYGLGGTFILPTSKHDLVASHQYQAGPSIMAFWANKDWSVGTLAQHWWGICDDGTNDVTMANHTDIQYFVVRHLPNAWQIRTSPHITYDWTKSSKDALTFPIALGFGKMVKLGKMPVMLMAEYQKSIIKPETVGNDYTLMFQANFIIQNPFAK